MHFFSVSWYVTCLISDFIYLSLLSWLFWLKVCEFSLFKFLFDLLIFFLLSFQSLFHLFLLYYSVQFTSVQSLSHVRLFVTPWITPGLPVHHQLPEFTQTHVHQVSDVIQPSHSLSSLSPTAHNPSQHQGLFQWVNYSYEVAKVLEFQPQHQSFQWTPRTGLL